MSPVLVFGTLVVLLRDAKRYLASRGLAVVMFLGVRLVAIVLVAMAGVPKLPFTPFTPAVNRVVGYGNVVEASRRDLGNVVLDVDPFRNQA